MRILNIRTNKKKKKDNDQERIKLILFYKLDICSYFNAWL